MLPQKPCRNMNARFAPAHVSGIEMNTRNPREDLTSLEKLMEKMTVGRIENYEKLIKIGQGSYGEVYRGNLRGTRKLFALKKILVKNENEGVPISALREIKILQLMKHENVVNLIEICRKEATSPIYYRPTYYLVFEFCKHDLAGLLNNVNVQFSFGEIKMVIKQLLNGLYFIHSNKILHRDMKTPNILVTRKGTIKIADFSLARAFGAIQGADKPNNYTNKVVTLWYRPPELLLGETNYGPSIDMWGVGCIIAEMWERKPILMGETEQHQLELISRLCGSITPETFPGCEKLPIWNQISLPERQTRKVKNRLMAYVQDPHALDLIDNLLVIDPTERIDCDTALNHGFFHTVPYPCELTRLLQPHIRSMFSTVSRQGQPRTYFAVNNR